MFRQSTANNLQPNAYFPPGRLRRRSWMANGAFIMSFFCLAGLSCVATTAPTVLMPEGALARPHPFLACSTGELERLQIVVRDHGPGCEILASRIRQDSRPTGNATSREECTLKTFGAA